MSLLSTLANLRQQNRAHLVAHWIPESRTDRPPTGERLEAGRHYVRLRLSEMFLRSKMEWGIRLHPAVHSLVHLDFGGQRVEIPGVADASRVGMQRTGRGDMVARDFLLTPAMPYNGGTIAFEVGLLAIAGGNYLEDLVHVLTGFSKLLAVPQLSAALGVAGPLATGLQRLLTGGDSQLHLGLHQSFGAGELRAGYVAVIRATEEQVATDRLCVAGDQLRLADRLPSADSVPLDGFDYLLLRVELFDVRDDWDELTAIKTPLQEAIRALGDRRRRKADFAMQQARVAARLAPELTRADRRSVIERLDTCYEEAKRDLGVSGLIAGDGPTLAMVMRGAMSRDLALQLGEPDLDELFVEQEH